MNWLKKIIRNWVLEAEKERRIYDTPQIQSELSTGPSQRNSTVTLSKAINGQVLQLTTWKLSKSPMVDHQQINEIYVLKEGDSLVEAVATLLMHHKLENL